MPLKEGVRLDGYESFAPIEKLGQGDHDGTCGRRRAYRLRLAFLEQGEPLAKEQILGNDGGVGGKEQSDQREQLHILQKRAGSSSHNKRLWI